MSDLLSTLRELRVVPVVVLDAADRALALRSALVEGGLPCAEITFRTAAAEDALARIAAEGDSFLLGAGTVLSPEQARRARAAGARFVVAPGFNPRVVDYCLEHDIPVFPGVATPTEIEAALERGLHALKLFPAEALGGLPYLKAIAAPYGDVEFIPTGGIDAGNLPSYLGFDRVLACGGSWLAPRAWIRDGDFEGIRQEAARTVAIVREHGTSRAAARGSETTSPHGAGR